MSDLSKQWQNDCERLSEPHKQWEWQYKDRSYLDDWFKCDKPVRLNNPLVNYRRINSLALLFDLNDAENGGKVELKDNFGWEEIKPHPVIFMKSGDKIAILRHNRSLQHVSPENLRMKESRLKTKRG